MLTHSSWMLRLYLTGSIGNTLFIAVADPASQHSAALDMTTPLGAVAIAFMAVIVFFSFLDILFNDFLPDQIHLEWTHKHRHLAFCALAGCQLGLMYGSYDIQGVEPVMSRYVWDALASCLVAGWGVYKHWQKAHAICRSREVSPK